ncbi:hypothetical protein DEI93_03385 [Curtobacterium sp. MCBD17_035]|uniref:ApeA N-terminal domain 1-containing protein n=1 Tax=Curtobacterium sp. MCBD17_035 TaxID=2175673 RepID=UPI000DA8B803|nr:HEPN domain-containing protein [Curtobacterium sp. MCBD17_035]WIB68099.1 hypothetical protein DEI93_03385 [Curtobacterium sp. MCBD17_035]
MANTLDVGDRRFGQLLGLGADGRPIEVLLERTDTGISLTVTWASSEDAAFASWFVTESAVSSTEGGARPSPPRRLRFHDTKGFVTLLGCYSGGYTIRHGGLASGTIRASFAVLDAPRDTDFDHIGGARSSVSHLQGWLGVKAWQAHEKGEGGRTTELAFEATLPEAIDLGMWGGTRTQLKTSAIQRNLDDGVVQLESQTSVETTRSYATSWDRHLRPSRALHDLLVISGWNREHVSMISVHHPSDTHPTASGQELPWWRPVVSADVSVGDRPRTRNHLITWADLGVDGIRRWFCLRERYMRVIDPVVTSISLRNATPTTILAQTGPALEALGYYLLLRDGLARSRANKMSLGARLERIFADVNQVMPFDETEWIDRFTSAYNGIKHANRQLPDDLDVVNAQREGILVVRAWCALELGADAASLRQRVLEDPQAVPFIRR